MTTQTHLSRSIDYLGDLGAKLRDLQGFGTLIHELIQNADDARASWMAFDVREDCLVLDNDGVFSDCHKVENSECLWSSDGVHGYRCDFHRFRVIGSADKRLQPGTTGAFGIGFITVLQLTDRPELISAGRHWVLEEEADPDKRIVVCIGCARCQEDDLPGTRFVFPYAHDRDSELRKALQTEPVPKDVGRRMLDELERSLSIVMLFLKSLATVEVKKDGSPLRKFEREIDVDTVIISQGNSENDRIWKILRGNFEYAATSLRERHPRLIEDKRSSEVMVALPDREFRSGLLCACLPTEDSPGLPFHINADFFPSNDRKHVLLSDDYQSSWNRQALLAAAKTVAEAATCLVKSLGAKHFWHIVNTLYSLYNAQHDEDGVWSEFWDALIPALMKEKVVLTSSGDWKAVSDDVWLLQRSDEAANMHVLEGLGIDIVDEDLRSYQTVLRHLGVRFLDVDTICSALISNGLDEPVALPDLPPFLRSDSNRESLWKHVVTLLDRNTNNPHVRAVAEERIKLVALAPTLDGYLWPCYEVYADSRATIKLFSSLELGIPFLDRSQAAFRRLEFLCSPFGAEDAIDYLVEATPDSLERLWKQGRLSLPALVEWFDNQRGQIQGDEQLRRQLASLSIFPSANRLCPLDELVLPGNFEDPFGLTDSVDVSALGGRQEFLRALGVNVLDFRTFVIEYLAEALNEPSLSAEIRQNAVNLLAERFSEFMNDKEVQGLLSSSFLILCQDGSHFPATECYFPNEDVKDVLGERASVALLPDEPQMAIKEFWKWLGVADRPRYGDIIRTVQLNASGPFTANSVERTRRVLSYLGRVSGGLEDLSGLEALRSIEWLPARGNANRWHKPDSLYAPYQAYLFDTQAAILDAPSPNRELLDFLGVNINPSPDMVVAHLLERASRNEGVNPEVYRFLDNNFSDSAIKRLKSKSCLWLDDAYRSPEQVFWAYNPFGRYRLRLSDSLRSFGRLLNEIGVAETPDFEDALRVISELSSEFSPTNRPLDEEAHSVLMRCWEMLETALDDEELDSSRLEHLKGIKCVPNKDDLLYFPTWLFFENRVGLASKFGEFLSSNVIPRQLGTVEALLTAGVQLLGSAVEIELTRADDPSDSTFLRQRLTERLKEIARVLSNHLPSKDVGEALNRLTELSCKTASSLELRFSLQAFNSERKSEPESATTLYQPAKHLLWMVTVNDETPWASLSRELAIALCPENDPGVFAAGLKEVLASDTALEAAEALDELGFSQLDTAAIRDLPNEVVALHLGLDLLLEHETLFVQQEEDVLGPEVGEKPDPDPEENGQFPESGEPTDEHQDPNAELNSDIHPKKVRKFISYVEVDPEDKTVKQAEGHIYEENMELEEKAIVYILEREPELSRTKMNNPGFDLEGFSGEGESVKWVEVKAMSDTLRDRPVGLSRTQFEYAQKRGDAYWLYVVERAHNCEEANLIRIQNPAGQAQTFTFDHGWIAVADASK